MGAVSCNDTKWLLSKRRFQKLQNPHGVWGHQDIPCAPERWGGLTHCPAAKPEQAELVPAVTTEVTEDWGAAARHAHQQEHE